MLKKIVSLDECEEGIMKIGFEIRGETYLTIDELDGLNARFLPTHKDGDEIDLKEWLLLDAEERDKWEMSSWSCLSDNYTLMGTDLYFDSEITDTENYSHEYEFTDDD